MCPMFSEAVPKEQRCPAKAFDDRDVARFCQAETFNEYNRQKLALKEKQIVEQVEKDFEERLAREKQRAMETSSAEEKLLLAKEHVIEKVLTLSCPRCEQAFVDFDGCFALRCARCQAGFCAYCLADCGRDAHAHIPAVRVREASHKVGAEEQVDGKQQRSSSRNVWKSRSV